MYSKCLTTLLSILFFLSNVTLVHSTEVNFWKERRIALSGDSSHNQNQQVASLPSFLNPHSKINPDFLQSLQTKKSFNRISPKYSNVSNQLQTLIESIPQRSSNIQEVYDSGTFKIPPIVIIQDVHLNSEAQTNIADVLQELINQEKIGIVGVEGAFEKIDFSDLRSFPDKKISQFVSDSFLKNNVLAAPSYVGVTSPTEPPVFVGVDDKHHYDANVHSFLSTMDSKKIMIQQLDKIRIEIIEEKNKNLSGELKEFDDLRMAYHAGNIGLGSFAKRLVEFKKDPPLVLGHLLEAYEFEKRLDFNKVNTERKIIITKLTKHLSEKEMAGLISASLAYRLGKLSFGSYYKDLRKLCISHNIDLRRTPTFNDYIQYVLLSDGINAQDLFRSLSSFEESIVNDLVKTPGEERIIKYGLQIQRVRKLFDFSLTPLEWDHYLTDKDLLKDKNEIFSSLGEYEVFYKEAQIRSHRMLDNLLEYPAEGNKALIVGGFHTPDITRVLKKEKTSFIVISPKITKVEGDQNTSYLSVFAREKTPLEKLFVGEKLFINSQTVNFSYPFTRFRWKASSSARTIGNIGQKVRFQMNWNEPLEVDVEINSDPTFDSIQPAQAIIKPLQDYFGEFGKSKKYTKIVGPILEDWGYFGFLIVLPILLILRSRGDISDNDFQKIKSNFGNIGRKTLIFGYRGFPILSGLVVYSLSPAFEWMGFNYLVPPLALITVLISNIISVVLFAAAHESGERGPPITVGILSSLLSILHFLWFPFNSPLDFPVIVIPLITLLHIGTNFIFKQRFSDQKDLDQSIRAYFIALLSLSLAVISLLGSDLPLTFTRTRPGVVLGPGQIYLYLWIAIQIILVLGVVGYFVHGALRGKSRTWKTNGIATISIFLIFLLLIGLNQLLIGDMMSHVDKFFVGVDKTEMISAARDFFQGVQNDYAGGVHFFSAEEILAEKAAGNTTSRPPYLILHFLLGSQFPELIDSYLFWGVGTFSVSILISLLVKWISKHLKPNYASIATTTAKISLVASIFTLLGNGLNIFDYFRHHGVYDYLPVPIGIASPGDLFMWTGLVVWGISTGLIIISFWFVFTQGPSDIFKSRPDRQVSNGGDAQVVDSQPKAPLQPMEPGQPEAIGMGNRQDIKIFLPNIIRMMMGESERRSNDRGNQTPDYDSVWLKEVKELGYHESREGIIAALPFSGVQDMGLSDEAQGDQFELIKKDLAEVIREKSKGSQSEKSINILQAGLGQMVYETEDFIKSVVEVLKATVDDPDKWSINLFGVDRLPGVIDRAREFMAEELPTKKYPNVKINFETANFADVESLTEALRKMGAENLEADYILQRNVTYPNFNLFNEDERISLPGDKEYISVPLDKLSAPPTRNQLKHLGQVLRPYLAYRNLLLLAGKPRTSDGRLGTRMVLETSPFYSPLSGSGVIPLDQIMDFVPLGVARIGPKGMGVIEYIDHEVVSKTTISNYQATIRGTSIREALSNSSKNDDPNYPQGNNEATDATAHLKPSFELIEPGQSLDHSEREENIRALARQTGLLPTEVELAYDTMVSDMARRVKNEDFFPAGIDQAEIYFLDMSAGAIGFAPLGEELLTENVSAKVTITKNGIVLEDKGGTSENYPLVRTDESLKVRADGTVLEVEEFVRGRVRLPMNRTIQEHLNWLETGGAFVPNLQNDGLKGMRVSNRAIIGIAREGERTFTGIKTDERSHGLDVAIGFHFHPTKSGKLSDPDISMLRRRYKLKNRRSIEIVFTDATDSSYEKIPYSHFYKHIPIPITLPQSGIKLLGHLYVYEEDGDARPVMYGVIDLLREIVTQDRQTLSRKRKVDKIVNEALEPVRDSKVRLSSLTMGDELDHIHDYLFVQHSNFGTDVSSIWKEFGLEKEYREYFKADEEYWNSELSFYEIYQNLNSMKKKSDEIDGTSGATSNALHLSLWLTNDYKPTVLSLLTLIYVVFIEGFVLKGGMLATGPPILILSTIGAFLYIHFKIRKALAAQNKISDRSVLIGTLSDIFVLSMYLLFPSPFNPLEIQFWIPIAIHTLVDAGWIGIDIKRSKARELAEQTISLADITTPESVAALVPSEKLILDQLGFDNPTEFAEIVEENPIVNEAEYVQSIAYILAEEIVSGRLTPAQLRRILVRLASYGINTETLRQLISARLETVDNIVIVIKSQDEEEVEGVLEIIGMSKLSQLVKIIVQNRSDLMFYRNLAAKKIPVNKPMGRISVDLKGQLIQRGVFRLNLLEADLKTLNASSLKNSILLLPDEINVDPSNVSDEVLETITVMWFNQFLLNLPPTRVLYGEGLKNLGKLFREIAVKA